MLRRRAVPLVAKLTTVAGATLGGLAPTPSTSPLLTSAVAFGAANAAWFGISCATGSHVHLDLIGTGAFAVSAALTSGAEARQFASSAFVGAWAVKLAAFLFYRALQTRHDGRLTDILSTNSGAFGFWFISFAWGWVVSLPHTLAAGVAVAARPPLGSVATDALGFAAFAGGLLLETVADLQKWQFKADPANKGKFCDAGVWKLSQHPNWAGNLLMWTGITIFNAPTLLAAAGKGVAAVSGRGLGRLAAACASPLFMVALFYAQAKGSMGPDMASAKYGKDAGFQQWAKETPLVVPSPAHVWRLVSGGKSD